MVYCSDDPIAARQLEEIGCCAVMPLASLIGSGMGILNPWNLQIIIDNAKVPIIVDAGVGTASDAAIAMELGCQGVLMNTAIATAGNPVMMASAMKKAVEAGREAFLAGRHAQEAVVLRQRVRHDCAAPSPRSRRGSPHRTNSPESHSAWRRRPRTATLRCTNTTTGPSAVS